MKPFRGGKASLQEEGHMFDGRKRMSRYVSMITRWVRSRHRSVEVALTAAGFLVFRHFGLVGTLPLAVLIALLAASGLVTGMADRLLGGAASGWTMHVRRAVNSAAVTTVIYATGWGPALSVGYLVGVGQETTKGESEPWGPAIAWSLAGLAVGEVAVATHLAPSVFSVKQAHGLAVLSGLGVAFGIRWLGVRSHERAVANTERLASDEALRLSEQRFRSLVQNASDVISVVDAEGAIRYMSPSSERILGYRPEELVGRQGWELSHPDDVGPVTEVLNSGEGNRSIQFRMRHADGDWYWHEGTVQNLIDDPAVCGIVVNHRDVSEQRAQQTLLSYHATYDPITGLLLRRPFVERLNEALSKARRHGRLLAVLFVDLDNFKEVNDTQGHHAGDELLREVGCRLTSCLRPEDVVARFAGDEFVVLTEDLADDEAATEVSQRVAAAISGGFVLQGHQLRVCASVGIAIGPSAGCDAEELLRQADLDMYRSKRRHRRAVGAAFPAFLGP
jgi:diguanylate cyclase (GGDEF)-like protein/PAS domain S-box-containing protein